MVTVPVYWPTGSTVPSARTCTVDGVVPVAGVALSQLTPFRVEAVTVKFKGAGLPVTAMLCEGGTAPPATWVKVSVVVGAEMVPGSTLKCTLMVAGEFPAPGEVTTMVPL
jgi:N-acetylmuramic acid 6-phosphate (MurNAc-6-P) etherase